MKAVDLTYFHFFSIFIFLFLELRVRVRVTVTSYDMVTVIVQVMRHMKGGRRF